MPSEHTLWADFTRRQVPVVDFFEDGVNDTVSIPLYNGVRVVLKCLGNVAVWRAFVPNTNDPLAHFRCVLNFPLYPGAFAGPRRNQYYERARPRNLRRQNFLLNILRTSRLVGVRAVDRAVARSATLC